MAQDHPDRTPEHAPDRPQTTATGRVEAFSDGVFAIAVTLLVLDLRPPEPGTFRVALLEEWPTYLAYLVAFFTIGSIWLSHHNSFSRVARVDPVLLVLNLLLLLGTSLVPWPTALMSTALNDGERDDQSAAVFVYALVTLLIGLSFVLLYGRLARRPDLLRNAQEQRWMRQAGRQSLVSIVVAVIGSLVALAAPLAALALFLITPAAFFVISLRARTSVDPGVDS